jgi:hypothetical protein
LLKGRGRHHNKWWWSLPGEMEEDEEKGEEREPFCFKHLF